MTQNAKYQGQRSFGSKVIVPTHTQTEPITLPGPLKWSITSVLYQGRSQKFVLRWYKLLLHNTAVRYTSRLTSSAAISAQHNFQGLILGGYIHRESKKGCHPNHGYNFVNS